MKANAINCIQEPCEFADSDNEPTNEENILNGSNQICTPNEVKMQECNRYVLCNDSWLVNSDSFDLDVNVHQMV